MARLDDLKRMVAEHGDSDECLLWPFANNGRYGRILASKPHIVAFEIFISPIHDKVLHRCDVGLCFNPRHLFSGSQGDNMRDASQKGRLVRHRGTAHWRSREIAEKQSLFLEIKMAYVGGVTMRDLSLKFGVSTSMIWKVVNNQHLTRSTT